MKKKKGKTRECDVMAIRFVCKSKKYVGHFRSTVTESYPILYNINL